MPIDLDDYTPDRQTHLRAVGVCAVFAVGADETGPVQIGASSDLRRWLAGQNLVPHYCLWTPGRPVAVRIATYVCQVLPPHDGDWCAVDVARAVRTIEDAAAMLYPGIRCLTHRQLFDRIFPHAGPLKRRKMRAITVD